MPQRTRYHNEVQVELPGVSLSTIFPKNLKEIESKLEQTFKQLKTGISLYETELTAHFTARAVVGHATPVIS